jgi:hypothetical protein
MKEVMIMDAKKCFCGAEPLCYTICNVPAIDGAYVVCDVCGTETRVLDGDLQKAIEIWNNRW